jgi:hypothetical protein
MSLDLCLLKPAVDARRAIVCGQRHILREETGDPARLSTQLAGRLGRMN